MQFPDTIVPFVQEVNYMVLGTLRHDTTIQMSIVWYLFENGKFLVSTTTDRAKYKNIERNSHVTFLIFDTQNPYKFIQVRGSASLTKENAHDLIDKLSEKYTGNKIYQGDPEHKEDRVIIGITPEDYVANGFTI